MNQLGLTGMAHAFVDLDGNGDAASLNHAEWLALLLDHEATWRNDKRLALRLRQAKLRHQAAPEDVDYRRRRSTLVTSQLPIARWFDLIGDPTYADAILDRLVHNAHRLELSGESMRRNLSAQAA